jgi:hypothetical protein
MRQKWALIALYVSCTSWAASVTYRVAENAGACSEVRVPKWTRPEVDRDPTFPVSTWGCAYDVRSAGRGSIYLGLSCGSAGYWSMKEKYAVDVSKPQSVRLIDGGGWQVANVLEPANLTEPEHARFQSNGLEYQGHMYPKSGPNWDLYGKALASPGQSRIAVYSYEGIVQRSYEPSFGPQRFEGTYWTEIYDVASAKRLIQIRGGFNGVDLTELQGKSYWYGGRFFLQPLEVKGMRRLLICDVDAAARSNGVAEADAPVPLSRAKPYLHNSRSPYQMRFLETDTPQAHVTAFRDEPVFYPGTSDIERLNITASLDVQVPGRYLLTLDLSGMQEMAEGELSKGEAQLTVPFPVTDLRQIGSGGPYTIHLIQLIRLATDGQILAQSGYDRLDAKTQPYSLKSIGSSLYLTGENSATLIRGMGAERDRLEVRIGIFSQATDCKGGGFLTRADPSPLASVSGAPGRKTLVQTFTGKALSAPGPYHIEQVIVRCDNDYISPGEIVVLASGAPSK